MGIARLVGLGRLYALSPPPPLRPLTSQQTIYGLETSGDKRDTCSQLNSLSFVRGDQSHSEAGGGGVLLRGSHAPSHPPQLQVLPHIQPPRSLAASSGSSGGEWGGFRISWLAAGLIANMLGVTKLAQSPRLALLRLIITAGTGTFCNLCW